MNKDIDLNNCILHGDLIIMTKNGTVGTEKFSLDTQNGQLSFGIMQWDGLEEESETELAIVRLFNKPGRSDFLTVISGDDWCEIESHDEVNAFFASKTLSHAMSALNSGSLIIGSRAKNNIPLSKKDVDLILEGNYVNPLEGKVLSKKQINFAFGFLGLSQDEQTNLDEKVYSLAVDAQELNKKFSDSLNDNSFDTLIKSLTVNPKNFMSKASLALDDMLGLVQYVKSNIMLGTYSESEPNGDTLFGCAALLDTKSRIVYPHHDNDEENSGALICFNRFESDESYDIQVIDGHLQLSKDDIKLVMEEDAQKNKSSSSPSMG